MFQSNRVVKGIGAIGVISLLVALSVVFASGFAGQSVAATATNAPVVLLQDSFDTENGGIGLLDYDAFANWNVLDGTVDLIGNGFFDLLPIPGLYVDLDGSSANAGKMVSKTAFTLDPGEYELKFDLAGSQRGDTNTMLVTLGSVYSESFTRESSAALETVTRTIKVAAATTGELSFDHDGGDNLGLLIDDVELTMVVPLVLGPPVPGTAGEDNVFSVSGGTPGATVHFIGSGAGGAIDVPGCPGEVVDLSSPKLLGSAVADSAGNASIVVDVPGSAAGKKVLLQAVELSSCRVSNLVQHTFG